MRVGFGAGTYLNPHIYSSSSSKSLSKAAKGFILPQDLLLADTTRLLEPTNSLIKHLSCIPEHLEEMFGSEQLLPKNFGRI